MTPLTNILTQTIVTLILALIVFGGVIMIGVHLLSWMLDQFF